MGKEWDDFSTAKPGQNNGGFFNHSGNARLGINTATYDRQTFIAFLTSVMTEALRVLKPGGHALVWALPRTSHWTATALEDAGFEVRDKLYHLFGSGFPKSLDISKAIDKMQGAEREVIGKKVDVSSGRPMSTKQAKAGSGQNINEGWDRPWRHDDNHAERMTNITAPATPEAQQWQGYGSALKPAVEEWVLCRKPLSEPSIASNVLKHGVGGLNIDATRVGTDNTIRSAKGGGYDGGWKPLDVSGSTQGRWPSHLLLSHSIFCVPTGTKRVRGANWRDSDNERDSDRNAFHHYNPLGASHKGHYADEDGMDEVEAYECHESCPILQIDLQSGIRKSGIMKPGQQRNASQGKGGYHGDFPDTATVQGTYGDHGGASRYFQHFPVDEPDFIPFTYAPKASRSERNQGCEGLPEVHPFDRETSKNFEKMGSKSTPSANSHPTVKPQQLMRWLIRLITPPNGVVLDCFGGSGSTAVAAIQENVHYILIESEQEYVAIANARIEYAKQHAPHPVPQEEYDCAPDCPIRRIGEQSGVSKSTASVRRNHNKGHEGWSGGTFRTGDLYSPHNDTGTAARYFQQFPPDSLFADCDEEAPHAP